MKTTYAFGKVSIDMAGGAPTAELPDPVRPKELPAGTKQSVPNAWRLVSTAVTALPEGFLLVVWTWSPP